MRTAELCPYGRKSVNWPENRSRLAATVQFARRSGAILDNGRFEIKGDGEQHWQYVNGRSRKPVEMIAVARAVLQQTPDLGLAEDGFLNLALCILP
jgi:hypothetical protein